MECIIKEMFQGMMWLRMLVRRGVMGPMGAPGVSGGDHYHYATFFI